MITGYRIKDTGEITDGIYNYIDQKIDSDKYQEILDEGELIRIGELTFLQGRALRLLDPIAFECDRSAYVDAVVEDLLAYGNKDDFAQYGLEVIEEGDE